MMTCQCESNRQSSETSVNMSRRHYAIVWRLLLLLSFSGLAGQPSVVHADPIKELRAVQAQRGKAFREQNLDAFMEHVADNVVFAPEWSNSRFLGKEAMRAGLADALRRFPTFQVRTRDASYRVFDEGRLILLNDFAEQSRVDAEGRTIKLHVRRSQVWKKIDERWLLVDHHVARVDGAP